MKNHIFLKENDCLTITEFAEFVGTTTETLRFYDRQGLFKPAQYGDGIKNKHRLYSVTQMQSFKMIRVLKEIGVPIEIIKAYADGEKTPQTLIKLLSKQKDILASELEFKQESHSLISTQLELLNVGLCATEHDVYVTELPEYRIILGDVCDYEGSYSFYSELARFCNAEHEPKLNSAYPIGGYWDSMDDFLHEAKMPETLPARFFSLTPKGLQKVSKGLYLIAYTRGYYGQTNDIPERMTAYAKKHGLIFNGPVYNIYPFDELCTSNPNEYLSQICASVKETKRVPTRRIYTP
jgi:DNA-binding transcriptional MerR regulator